MSPDLSHKRTAAMAGMPAFPQGLARVIDRHPVVSARILQAVGAADDRPSSLAMTRCLGRLARLES